MFRTFCFLSLAATSLSVISGCAGTYSFGQNRFFNNRSSPCCGTAVETPVFDSPVYASPIVDFPMGPCCESPVIGGCASCGDVTAFGGVPAFGAPVLTPGPVALPPIAHPPVIGAPTINAAPRLNPIPQSVVPQATPIPAPLN